MDRSIALPGSSHYDCYDISLALWGNSKVLLVGGVQNEKRLQLVRVLDISSTSSHGLAGCWSALPCPLHQTRANSSAVVVDNRLYIFGGTEEVVDNTFEIVDLLENTVTELPQPMAWQQMKCVSYQERLIFLLGGCNANEACDELWCFDTNTQTFQRMPSMGASRCRPAIGMFDDSIIVVGGLDKNLNNWQATAETFHIPSETWRELESMPVADEILAGFALDYGEFVVCSKASVVSYNWLEHVWINEVPLLLDFTEYLDAHWQDFWEALLIPGKHLAVAVTKNCVMHFDVAQSSSNVSTMLKATGEPSRTFLPTSRQPSIALAPSAPVAAVPNFKNQSNQGDEPSGAYLGTFPRQHIVAHSSAAAAVGPNVKNQSSQDGIAEHIPMAVAAMIQDGSEYSGVIYQPGNFLQNRSNSSNDMSLLVSTNLERGNTTKRHLFRSFRSRLRNWRRPFDTTAPSSSNHGGILSAGPARSKSKDHGGNVSAQNNGASNHGEISSTVPARNNLESSWTHCAPTATAPSQDAMYDNDNPYQDHGGLPFTDPPQNRGGSPYATELPSRTESTSSSHHTSQIDTDRSLNNVGSLIVDAIVDPKRIYQMQKGMPYFFIAHYGAESKEDIARPTHWFLKYFVKVDVFMDDEALEPGGDQELLLLEQAYKCTHALVILTPSFRNSVACVQELNTFMDRWERRDGIKIVPAPWRIENLDGYCQKFRKIVWIRNRTKAMDAAAYLIDTLWPKILESISAPMARRFTKVRMEKILARYVREHRTKVTMSVSLHSLAARYETSHGCCIIS